MILSLIAAIGNRGQLGLKGGIPWHVPEELRHFKGLTMGHHLLMGSRTFRSLPSGPLPGRTHIVLSRCPDKVGIPPGHLRAASLKEALALAGELGEAELFVCGGADIYAQTLDSAHRLYLSRVDYTGPADTFFPPWEHLPWKHVATHWGGPFECLTYHKEPGYGSAL